MLATQADALVLVLTPEKSNCSNMAAELKNIAGKFKNRVTE
jgi:hypothetical protein